MMSRSRVSLVRLAARSDDRDRLHATLIALRMGVPALHIAYTGKGRSICDLGLSDWLSGSTNFSISPEPLIRLADEVLSNRMLRPA